LADAPETRVTLTLTLDLSHWRRHDRAHWVQVLSSAVQDGAEPLLRAHSYELHEEHIFMHLRSQIAAKKLSRLWESEENLLRLRSRLADLGAQVEIKIEEA
jgi:hypothetical protein